MRTFFLLWAFIGFSGIVSAADPPRPSPPSLLDDELLKGLEEATTSPGLKPKAAAKKPAPPPVKSEPKKPATPAPDPLDDELLKQLEGDDPAPAGTKSKAESSGEAEGQAGRAGSGSDDPLVRLTEQIRDAETRLRRTETGDETQRLQKKIVDDLDRLIAQIEEQQRRQSQSQQQKTAPSPPGPPQPPKPGQQQPGGRQQAGTKESSQARDSQQGVRNSTARKADPGNLRSLLEKAWGNLPERERQAVMQSSVDDFPAKYQFVIEEYFKALLKREE